jgi:hypothetical protein
MLKGGRSTSCRVGAFALDELTERALDCRNMQNPVAEANWYLDEDAINPSRF